MRHFLLTAFLLFSLLLSAQVTDPYARIADRLAEYGRLTMNADLEGVLSFTDPELFEIVPKEVLYQQLAGLRSDENMQVVFSDFTVDNIGEVVSRDGVDYVPISFHHQLTFRMKSAEYREPEVLQRLARMMEKSYGSASVDEAAATVSLTARKSMFAIRRGVKKNWYFVEYRPENSAMVDLLVPPVVREQFN
ncbi:MAG: hypothetical protein AAGF89_12070 [Bacteroidota bacterium]